MHNANQERKTICIPSVMFALGIVVGASYEQVGTWDLVINVSNGGLLKSSIQFLGIYTILNYAISWLYVFIDRFRLKREEHVQDTKKPTAFHKYLLVFQRNPFTASIVTLMLFWLPFLILYYPGPMGSDAMAEILQSYGALKLTAHFPLIHIIMLKCSILFGIKVFSSSSIGLFLYNAVQLVSFVLGLSACILIAVKYAHVKAGYIAATLLYFCIHPQIHNFLLLINKDAFYSTFFLTYIVSHYLVIKNDIMRKKLKTSHILLLMLSIALVMSMRNEGAYIVFLTLILQFAVLRHSRAIISLIAVYSIAIFVVINTLVPYMIGAKDADGFDKYSIQIQQISRCVSEGKFLQGDNQKDLEQVFDVEKLRTSYCYQITDPSKSCFKIRKMDSNNRKLFSNVWLAYLYEYPATCIQATLHHNYNNFYFAPTYLRPMRVHYAKGRMEVLNDKLGDFNFYSSYPRKIHNCARVFEHLRENFIFNNCIGIIFSSSTTYVWLVIFILFYVLRAKSIKSVCFLFPLILSCVVLFLAPTGANHGDGGPRYCLPLHFVLPFLFPLTLHILKYERKN